MYNIIDLRNKKILITGASSGIGRETAILCSKVGAKVILVARNEEKLKSVNLELEGEGHKYYTFDLSNVDEIESFIKKIKEENGALDGFIHSAGIGSTRPLKLLKPSVMREVMSINFFSFIEIVRNITKKNFYNEGMSIVGVSSISSKQGNQSKTAYCSSKAAMDGAIRCIAKEFSHNKIRVNTVCPAMINTELYKQFLENSGESEDAKDIINRQYLGVGEPIDVANMIAFLLSDAAKFITGSSVNLDGGRLSS